MTFKSINLVPYQPHYSTVDLLDAIHETHRAIKLIKKKRKKDQQHTRVKKSVKLVELQVRSKFYYNNSNIQSKQNIYHNPPPSDFWIY